MIDFIAGRLVAEHDERCASRQGYPCNCALAALTPKPCTMGVGCDEAGVCYAAANDRPEECPKRHAWDDLFEELRCSPSDE